MISLSVLRQQLPELLTLYALSQATLCHRGPAPSLQAIVGNLVAKTLSSASANAYYGAQRAAAPPVAFDVFSVQVGAVQRGVQSACAGSLAQAGGSLSSDVSTAALVGTAGPLRSAHAGLPGALQASVSRHRGCCADFDLRCAARILQACTNTLMAHFVGMLFRCAVLARRSTSHACCWPALPTLTAQRQTELLAAVAGGCRLRSSLRGPGFVETTTHGPHMQQLDPHGGEQVQQAAAGARRGFCR